MFKFIRIIVVLSVFIAEFKLGAAFFLKGKFIWIKVINSLDAIGAIIVTAFIDRDIFAFFPIKEGVIAIRAEEFSFRVFTESL